MKSVKARITGWVALSLLIACNSCPGADDKSDVTPPQDLVALVKKALPDDWTCTSESMALVARPRKPFVFVNLVGADLRRSDETLEHYHQRHVVHFDYRIVLRFVPRMTVDQVDDLVEANEAIQQKLRTIEQDPLATPEKGEFWFAETSKGRALSRQYEELKRSLRPIPYGHHGSVSVYIEPTFLGYARFLRKEDKVESSSVLKDFGALFTPYGVKTPNKRP